MKIVQRLYTTVATVAAGFVAAKVVKLGWKAVSGSKAPDDADDLSASTVQVALFAGLLAAATAVAQTLASRKALGRLVAKEAKHIATVTGADAA
ncbi:MAG: DUF4235 domain-containing protein [Bifidobacteriaceae bacterium]|jgi:TRAP-type C4-dicarboxylate transport system permease small subunit|nr:DUF4235 domain-containing protein [Bifidobacteriaceae bacterium]